MAGRQQTLIRVDGAGRESILYVLRRHILKDFDKDLRKALEQGRAHAVTQARKSFTSRLSGRPTTTSRPGRPSTQGTFAQHIVYRVIDSEDAPRVDLELDALRAAAPYWLVQEIGTGQSAELVFSRGRSRTVSVPSQVGRIIPGRIQFVREGRYVPPSADDFRKDAMQPVTTRVLQRSSRRTSSARIAPIRIGREIEGKHYLRDGGNVGWRVFHTRAKRAFSNFEHPKGSR